MPKATHDPTEVYFEAIDKSGIMQTPRGPVFVRSGRDLRLHVGSDQWPMDIDSFLQRYGSKLDEEAREHIEEHFPGKLDGKK